MNTGRIRSSIFEALYLEYICGVLHNWSTLIIPVTPEVYHMSYKTPARASPKGPTLLVMEHLENTEAGIPSMGFKVVL